LKRTDIVRGHSVDAEVDQVIRAEVPIAERREPLHIVGGDSVDRQRDHIVRI